MTTIKDPFRPTIQWMATDRIRITLRQDMVKAKEIDLRPQKDLKRVDTNIAGHNSCCWYNSTWEDLLKEMRFRPEHFITDVSGKYSRLWALKGENPIDVNKWYTSGVLASICTVALGFQEISELPE
ncbi:hypothetical protein ACS0TY_017210 [Phlomoides rotata]